MEENRPKSDAVVMLSPEGNRTIIHALVPSNQYVQAIAKRFKWKPETLIARVEKALPSVVEQQIYLRLGADFQIHPESLAKLLREYLGSYELKPEDFFNKKVGENLVMNKFADVAEFLEGALNLINKVSIEYSGFSISMRSAAVLVDAYGPDGAENLIDSIASRLDEVIEHIGGEGRSFDRAMSIAIYFLVNKVMPEMRSHGAPAVLDIMDFFEDIDTLVQYELNRALGKDD